MRILVDLQGCQSESRSRGIGRYLLGLARALCQRAAGHEVWLLLNDLLPATVMPLRVAFADLVPSERIAVFRAPGPVSEGDPHNRWRTRAAELIREHAIAELSPDIVLVGSLFEGFVDDAVVSIGRLPVHVPTAVVLYDLIPWIDWRQYLVTPLYRSHYLRKMDSLRRADLWLTISEASRAEACAVLGVASEAVVNVSVGLDARFRPTAAGPARRAELARRLGLSRPFLMHIGAIEPRKNLDALIAAYARLPEPLRRAHQLLLVVRGLASEQERLRTLARAHGLSDPTVVVVSDVPDEDLISLYSTCALFVFPTLHEGFGLPVLEAMACGAVAIGSATSSIPELIGCDGALFDPRSIDDMARVMARALGDVGLRASLRAAAPARVARFSWDAAAERTLRALEQLAEQRPASRSAAYRSLAPALALEEGTPSREDLVACAEAIAWNRAPDPEPQLLVDVSELAERDARTGIQRVVRAILLQWLKQPPAGYRVEPIRFDRASGHYLYARRFSAEFAVAPRHPAAGDTRVDARRGDLFVGLDLVADRLPVDWIAALRRRGVRIAFVVYDTLPLRSPHWWPEGTGAVFEAWGRAVVEHGDVVIGISRFVTEDLKLWMAEKGLSVVRPPHFRHFALGADLAGTSPSRGLPTDARAVLERVRRGPTFLMVGTLEPRKGHAQALAAFEELWREGCDVRLAIVGRRGWMMETTLERLRVHPERGKRLFWLEGVSDEYLELLFGAASALLAASEGEGFGLPLIEAARHGLPLLARDLPVFREVAGDHPAYFSGTSPSDLAQAVRAWLAMGASAKARRTPLPVLTWAESAQQLWAALEPGDPDEADVES